MDAAGRHGLPKPKNTMTRVVVTFTSESGVSTVSLARLQMPGMFLRYWIEDHQPLAHVHLGERLREVECTRATANDEDFGTKTWPLVRVARNEPYHSGDHLVVLEPMEEPTPSDAAPDDAPR